jgi:hypothetical protein
MLVAVVSVVDSVDDRPFVLLSVPSWVCTGQRTAGGQPLSVLGTATLECW